MADFLWVGPEHVSSRGASISCLSLAFHPLSLVQMGQLSLSLLPGMGWTKPQELVH